jgi:polyhydroxyalkanoate synthase
MPPRREKRFADYMREGILEALTQIEKQTGQKQANAIGYCIGGTLLASTLGYMAAKGENRIKSATFFTTRTDFTYAGDLKVFVDEEQISAVEEKMSRAAIWTAGHVIGVQPVALQRPDLVLRGQQLPEGPRADALRPAVLERRSDPDAGGHALVLSARDAIWNNHLSQGKMTLDQVRIDLGKVKVPSTFWLAREDHIAPLPSVFKLGEFFGGETELVVAGSGHIAGVINPPESQASTSTGPTRRAPGRWTTGWPVRRNMPVPGGLTGRTG